MAAETGFPARLIDRLACEELCARYAYCCDRDRDRVVELFSEDAVLSLVGRTMRGHAEIREGMRTRPGVATLHFCSNTVIDFEGEDSARGTTHLLSFGARGEPSEFPLPAPGIRSGGIYHDRFRRMEGRWLFSERRLEQIFAGPR